MVHRWACPTLPRALGSTDGSRPARSREGRRGTRHRGQAGGGSSDATSHTSCCPSVRRRPSGSLVSRKGLGWGQLEALGAPTALRGADLDPQLGPWAWGQSLSVSPSGPPSHAGFPRAWPAWLARPCLPGPSLTLPPPTHRPEPPPEGSRAPTTLPALLAWRGAWADPGGEPQRRSLCPLSPEASTPGHRRPPRVPAEPGRGPRAQGRAGAVKSQRDARAPGCAWSARTETLSALPCAPAPTGRCRPSGEGARPPAAAPCPASWGTPEGQGDLPSSFSCGGQSACEDAPRTLSGREPRIRAPRQRPGRALQVSRSCVCPGCGPGGVWRLVGLASCPR